MTDWATYARAVNQAARALVALLPAAAEKERPSLRVALFAKASAVRSLSLSTSSLRRRRRG